MKKSRKEINWEKAREKEEITRRYNNRNWEAMKFCNKQGLIIYPSCQANSSLVKLFVQKGIPFKPLNDILYDQKDPEDVKRYVAEIDKRYELLYNKMKNKV